MGNLEKVKVVVSDCHLSAGMYYEGRRNVHEDFYFDDEMIEMLEYYSTGVYGEGMNVEFILAGDFLDFLNVPIEGDFVDVVTEDLAVHKVKAILQGHRALFEKFRQFASLPGKSITYMIGNHDADLFFKKVREEIIQAWDPEGQIESQKIRIIWDQDRYTFEELGVEIRHGNQFEPASELDFEEPIYERKGKPAILNLPWGSVYVLKISNRLRWECEYIDRIRPIKLFVLLNLILDPRFTLKFLFLTSFYFVRTRLSWHGMRRGGMRKLFHLFRHETTLWQDNEAEARNELNRKSKIKTLIFGHTHTPMDKIYPDGKQYINTGTWTKMINLDWRGLGQRFSKTFALIEVRDGKTRSELRQWTGQTGPHRRFGG